MHVSTWAFSILQKSPSFLSSKISYLICIYLFLLLFLWFTFLCEVHARTPWCAQTSVSSASPMFFDISHQDGHYPNTAILLIQFFIVFFQSDPVSDYTAAHTSYTGQDQAYITPESVLILNIICPSGRFAGLEGPGTKVYQSTHNQVRISGKQDTPYWFPMPRNDTEGRIRTKCFEVVRHFLDPIPGRFL